MSKNAQKIGWIGIGRMGTPMAERLLKAGHDVSIWNRTRAKAEPLAAKGGKIVDKLVRLAACDVVFSIVSTGKDLEEVYLGKDGVLAGAGKMPKMLVDCSSISVEESAAIRKRLAERGVELRRRAGVRQRQGDQGRQAVVGGLRAGGGLPRR